MEIPNAFYRISVKALVLNEEGKFLLAKEAKGVWELLGGGLDFGEEPLNGLRREIQEETGLTVTSIEERPSYFFTVYHENKEQWKSNVVYKTELADLNFTPSDECVELKFFSAEEVELIDALPNVVQFASIFKPENHE